MYIVPTVRTLYVQCPLGTYSLSDSSLAITFATFFVTKHSSLPSKLDKPLWRTTTCMYKHTFWLSSAKCWFCSLVPIVKCALPTLLSRVFVYCEQYKHARLYCWQWTHFTMGPNEQNQHTHSSAPNMLAKFGWKTWTFCHKKVAKVIGKLESDRL